MYFKDLVRWKSGRPRSRLVLRSNSARWDSTRLNVGGAPNMEQLKILKHHKKQLYHQSNSECSLKSYFNPNLLVLIYWISQRRGLANSNTAFEARLMLGAFIRRSSAQSWTLYTPSRSISGQSNKTTKLAKKKMLKRKEKGRRGELWSYWEPMSLEVILS